MRRFSQKNHLVTLSDINITPLLDLAFVLLIIFIITTPLLEHSIKMDLPEGGGPDQKLTREDIRIVEIDRQGRLRLSGRLLTFPLLERVLTLQAGENPNLTLRVYVDRESKSGQLVQVIDFCTQNGIALEIPTEPKKTP